MDSTDESIQTQEGLRLLTKRLKDLGMKKVITALTLMKNGKISDTDLMKVLNLGTSNSAAYYRKELESEGVIKGYRAEIDWKKLGYVIHFSIIIEGETPESLLEMEEKLVLSIKKYGESVGDVCIIPTRSGGIILEDVSFYFGKKAIGIIEGHATSKNDVVMYSKYHLVDVYPKIKTTIEIVKNNAIKNFIINKESSSGLPLKDELGGQKGKGKTDYSRLVKNLEDFFG